MNRSTAASPSRHTTLPDCTKMDEEFLCPCAMEHNEENCCGFKEPESFSGFSNDMSDAKAASLLKGVQVAAKNKKLDMEKRKVEQVMPLEVYVFGKGLVMGNHEGSRIVKNTADDVGVYKVDNYTIEACGKGTFTSSEVFYNGHFLNNVFHDLSGTATLEIHLNSKFTGSFSLGQRSGHGVLEKCNPETGLFYVAYDGSWKNDMEYTGIYYSKLGDQVGWIVGGHHQERETNQNLVPFGYLQKIPHSLFFPPVQVRQFDPEKMYIISLADRRGKYYGTDQSGWELCAHRVFNEDNRSYNSTYVIIHRPEHEFCRYWNIRSYDGGETYIISLADKEVDEYPNTNQSGWELSGHRAFESDLRSDSSTYAIIHQPEHRFCKHWNIISDDGGMTFMISLSGRVKADHFDVDQEGWELSAHRAYDEDKRNINSTKVILHQPQHAFCRYWKIEEA